MNDVEQRPVTDAPDLQREPAAHRATEGPPKDRAETRPRWGGRLLGLGALLVLAAGLAVGAWRFYSQDRAVTVAAEQRRDFVPSVRTAKVRASDPTMLVSLPATTLAFTTANVFARASGYIDKLAVDIGDRVKAGDLLVHITAPELNHQISQSEATVIQLKAALAQAQANVELAQVTWNRDRPMVEKGWVTQQQGTIDVQTLKANQAAVGVAQANIVAQEAQLRVLKQQLSYQTVVATFDGVITQRNINVGDLMQADATSGTFMFTMMKTDVIRTQVYVPQEQAFGVAPGVDADVRVPEIPGRKFAGKVTRLADALQPGTRTLLTEIDIPNPDGALRPGSYVVVELHIPRKTPSFVVPAEAIIFNREGLQVAVIDNGTARIHKVMVARDMGTQVEIHDGLKDGDLVILNPPLDLVDGSRVQARPEPARSSN